MCSVHAVYLFTWVQFETCILTPDIEDLSCTYIHVLADKVRVHKVCASPVPFESARRWSPPTGRYMSGTTTQWIAKAVKSSRV